MNLNNKKIKLNNKIKISKNNEKEELIINKNAKGIKELRDKILKEKNIDIFKNKIIDYEIKNKEEILVKFEKEKKYE